MGDNIAFQNLEPRNKIGEKNKSTVVSKLYKVVCDTLKTCYQF